MDLRLSSSRFRTKDRIIAAVVMVLTALILCWAIILSGSQLGRGAADDWNYHWVAIQQFAQQLPAPDLTDYASATTPAYHLLLAGFAKAGLGHTGIQLIASLWTLLLFGILGWIASARFGKLAFVAVLPMLASIYVLHAGVWLLPDNAGWLGVLLILLLALRSEQGWRTWAISGLVLFVLVWFRQIHIWIAGVIWLSAWLGSQDQTPTLGSFFSGLFDRGGRAFIALACTVPAAGALFWFMGIWGGLVPPTFQEQHQGPNPATPGFILTQLAIISVFFLPMLWPHLKEAWKHQWAWIILAVIIGCMLGVLPASSYSYDDGRYSGWWRFVNQAPVVFDRSPIIMLGSVFGSIMLVVWLSLCTRRDAWIWIGAIVAFIVAQSANHASWQRYHEPMLLMMVLLILVRSPRAETFTRRVMLGSLALSLAFGAITAMSMYYAAENELQDQGQTTRHPQVRAESTIAFESRSGIIKIK